MSPARSAGTPSNASNTMTLSARRRRRSGTPLRSWRAGGKATDIVRLNWYVTDKRGYLAKQRELGETYRAVMGRHFPAMTLLVVSGLAEDDALVEIEATAVLGSP